MVKAFWQVLASAGISLAVGCGPSTEATAPSVTREQRIAGIQANRSMPESIKKIAIAQLSNDKPQPGPVKPSPTSQGQSRP